MKITGVVTTFSHSCRPICRKWRDFYVLLRSKKRVGDKTTCQFTIPLLRLCILNCKYPYLEYFIESLILAKNLPFLSFFFSKFLKRKRKIIPNFARLPRCKFLYEFCIKILFQILQILRDFFIYFYPWYEYLLLLRNFCPNHVRNNR